MKGEMPHPSANPNPYRETVRMALVLGEGLLNSTNINNRSAK